MNYNYSLYLVFSVFVFSACSSIKTVRNKDELTKVTPKIFEQRAPASMDPPQDDKNQFIDSVHIRSKADYHFTMGEAYSLDGETDKAIESFKLTLVYDPDSALVRVRLSAEYIKKGFISEAIEQAELSIQKDPNFLPARILLGSLYSTLKMFPKARAQYQAILDKEPNNEEAQLYMGALYVEEGNEKLAIRHFQKLANRKDAESAHLAYYYLGRLYFNQKKMASSINSFQRALEIRPRFVEGVLALGSVYESELKKKQAIELYQSYQDRFGDSYRVAEPLGRLYMEEEQLGLAYRQFEIIDKAARASLSTKVKMALILIEKDDYKMAIVKLKEILREVPESDKIRFYLAAVYEEIQDFNSAIDEFRTIPVSSSFYVEATIHGAYLLKQKSRYREAEEWVQSAIEARPDAVQLYTLHASLLDDQEKFSQGLALMLKAQERFPKNEQVLFFLGSFYDKMGKKKETLVQMQEILKINAENVQALNYLAYTLAEMNIRLEEAEKFAIKANSLKQDDPYITDTLGWIQFKRGNYSEAVRTLERAYSLSTTEGIIAEHLGDAYYRSELPSKAKRIYKKALELHSSEKDKAKVRAKIAAVENMLSNLQAIKAAGAKSIQRQPASSSTKD